jgi:hypothetical protein
VNTVLAVASSVVANGCPTCATAASAYLTAGTRHARTARAGISRGPHRIVPGPGPVHTRSSGERPRVQPPRRGARSGE